VNSHSDYTGNCNCAGHCNGLDASMVTLKCTVCGREYEAVYSNKLYCSSRCKTAAWRAKKKAAAAEAAPGRAELVAQLARFAPHTGALAREMISIAGDDCTELIVRLVAQAVREIGATVPAASPVATNGATKAQASRAEGVPMK